MNKQLRATSRVIFVMFLTLLVALTLIQVIAADSLRANPLNQRTTLSSFNVERGSILVEGNPIAYSVPSADEYKFQREYTAGEMYAPITGYFSNYQGSTGLERALNEELSGTGGNQFFNRINRILSGQKPQGSSVELTIKSKAQEAAYNSLEGMRGAVIALDPETGKILAMANSPSYDPNLLAMNNNQEVIKNYAGLEDDPDNPLYNRVIAGDMYIPGSVFKLVTAAAALESGKFTATSTVADPASWNLPGSSSVMRNWNQQPCADGSKATLEIALIRSCNIPIAEIATGLPQNAIPDTAAKLGFGSEWQIPLQSSSSTTGDPSDGAQRALTSIGQYDVRVTPLQIAMVTAAIANGGVQMQPTLVESVITPDLRTEQSFSPEEHATPISQSTANTLAQIMQRGVTDPTGLAKNAAISGAKVGGKTGTAQVGVDDAGNDLPYNLWFTGFAEKNGKKVVVAVVVEDGGGAAANYRGLSGVIPTQIGKKVMEAVLSE